jgi:hypothetical protein
VQSLLDRAVEHYAYAKELFKEWEGQGAARTPAEVERALAGEPEAQQLAWLRRQIEMRTIGLGWVQFATRYFSQSDRKIGTVAHLRAAGAASRAHPPGRDDPPAEEAAAHGG